MTRQGVMWYDPLTVYEIYEEGSINPQNVIGKPLVVYIDGQRREIGKITDAALKSGKLFIGAELDLSEAPEDLKEVMEDA